MFFWVDFYLVKWLKMACSAPAEDRVANLRDYAWQVYYWYLYTISIGTDWDQNWNYWDLYIYIYNIYIYVYIDLSFSKLVLRKKKDKCWSYDRDCVKQFCGQLQTTLNIEHKCHPLPSTGPSNMGVGQHHGTSWHQNSWSSWYNGWRLTYPSEKYEFVSWDDDIPNIWKKKHVWNHQPG